MTVTSVSYVAKACVGLMLELQPVAGTEQTAACHDSNPQTA